MAVPYPTQNLKSTLYYRIGEILTDAGFGNVPVISDGRIDVISSPSVVLSMERRRSETVEISSKSKMDRYTIGITVYSESNGIASDILEAIYKGFHGNMILYSYPSGTKSSAVEISNVSFDRFFLTDFPPEKTGREKMYTKGLRTEAVLKL